MNQSSARKLVKSAALQGLKSGGVFSIAGRSKWRRSRLLILCYHGISLHDEHRWAPRLYMSPESFRHRFAILRSMNASILPLEEALVRMQRNSLPPVSVAITFDDGFFDFVDLALPVLNEFQAPSTVYLTTYYTKHRLPVITLLLDYVLWKSGMSEIDAPSLGIDQPLPIRSYQERQIVVRKLLSWADQKNFGTIAKDEMAREIATLIGVDYGEILRRRMLQIMSPEEATDVVRAGADLQLHTHHHKTPQMKELFVQEILENRDRIAQFSGREPKHFCYPSGNYRAELLPWLRELGIISATTCVRGLAHANSEPLMMPRVLDDETVDPLRFESFVAGVLT